MWHYYNSNLKTPKNQNSVLKKSHKNNHKEKRVTFTTKRTSNSRKYLKFPLFHGKSARKCPFTDLMLHVRGNNINIDII